LLVCEQFIPTNTEASSWGIVQIDLTIAEAREYEKTSYEVNNPEPTPTAIGWLLKIFSPKNLYAQEEEQKILAYRKYKIDDLASIGCDTVGLKISAESKAILNTYRNEINSETKTITKSELVLELKKEKNKKDKNLFKSKIKEKKQKDIDDWNKTKKDKDK